MNLKSMQSRKKHMIEDTLSVQFHLCDLPGKAKPMDVLKNFPSGDGNWNGQCGDFWGMFTVCTHFHIFWSAIFTPKIFTFHSILKKKHK